MRRGEVGGCSIDLGFVDEQKDFFFNRMRRDCTERKYS